MSEGTKICVIVVSGLVLIAAIGFTGLIGINWVNRDYKKELVKVELKKIELEIERTKLESRKLLVE